MVDRGLDWRWVYWVSLIFSSTTFLIALLFLPETFASTLEKWKVEHIRSMTGDPHYIAPVEAKDSFPIRLKQNIIRPAKFFTTEPIIIFLGLYLVIIYAINFSFLSGFSNIFHDTYGLSDGITGLAFVSVAVGCLFNTALTPAYRLLRIRLLHRSHPTDADSYDPTPPPPELRIIPAAIAAPFLVLALLWLGWTNYSSISPLSGYFATALFGYALTAIFVSSYQYIIDSYETYSSSALASITVVRYAASAGVLVATKPMYERLGVHWTLTLVSGLALLMVPVPWVLWWYGSRIRARSEFAKKE